MGGAASGEVTTGRVVEAALELGLGFGVAGVGAPMAGVHRRGRGWGRRGGPAMVVPARVELDDRWSVAGGRVEDGH